jgi:GT2 family glycosyltransferase
LTLSTLCQDLAEIKYEIIVIDNASHDIDDATIWPENLDKSKFILEKLPENIGFGRACNHGAMKANYPNLVFLNPDTVIKVNSIKSWLQAYEAQDSEKIGLFGIQLRDLYGEYLKESMRRIPTLVNSFAYFSGLTPMINPNKTYHIAPNEALIQPLEVIAGAAFIASQDLYHQIGGFDERFFMYGEDIHISQKSRALGRDNLCYFGDFIYHFKGESAKKNKISYYFDFYQAFFIFIDIQKNLNFLSRFLLKYSLKFVSLSSFLFSFLKKHSYKFIDFTVILLLIFSFSYFWKSTYKPLDVFPLMYLYILLPLLAIAQWSIALLADWYADKKDLKNYLQLFFGVNVLFLAFYGLLPNEIRFSRAIILIAPWLVLFYQFSKVFLVRSKSIRAKTKVFFPQENLEIAYKLAQFWPESELVLSADKADFCMIEADNIEPLSYYANLKPLFYLAKLKVFIKSRDAANTSEVLSEYSHATYPKVSSFWLKKCLDFVFFPFYFFRFLLSFRFDLISKITRILTLNTTLFSFSSKDLPLELYKKTPKIHHVFSYSLDEELLKAHWLRFDIGTEVLVYLKSLWSIPDVDKR